MLIRRITLLVFGLLLLPVAIAVEDANPFARWDQLKKSTSPVPASSTIAAKPDPETGAPGTVEYFSATASAEGKAPKGDAAPVANKGDSSASQVKVERLRTAAKKELPPKPPEVTKALQPSPATDFVIQPLGRASETIESAAIERPTAFTSTAVGQSTIQQVSGEFVERDQQEPVANPFSEFVPTGGGESGVTSYDQAVPSPNVAENSIEPEAAAKLDATVTDTDSFSAPRGPQTPSVSVEWVHHSDFNIGQECRCELVLENTGRSLVRSVVAEAVLPAGLEVVSSLPAPATEGGTAKWTVGELQPGEKRLIELVIIPRKQGDIQLKAFVRLTGASSSTFSVKEPRVAVRIEGPGSVEVGQQANYTVHVANPGSGTAKNVVIQAAIPEGMDHREGKLLTIEIGTLSPGEFRLARLSLTGATGGEHSLAVRALADGGLGDQTMETVSVAEPRLNIGLRGPAERMTGQACEYEVVVVNEGQMQSNNVRAKYKVPEGCEFVSANRGGKFRKSDRTIDWFVGSLEPNQVSHFRITLRPAAAGTSTHQVGVISEHGKMTMAQHITKVKGNAQLHLTVVASNSKVYPGDETVFEVRIENTGASPAVNVGLSCELAAGLESLQVSGPSEYIADNGVMVFRSMPALDPGKTAVFAVRTRCVRPGSHKMRVRVASESVSEPLIGEETAIGLKREDQ
ncbi:MAG: hypothetical protein P8K08_11610 [Fuerstiella sp.]|nr:hypothetical protein [Fuerstiella sp.]